MNFWKNGQLQDGCRVPCRKTLQMPPPGSQRRTGHMCTLQTQITSIHAFMDAGRLPRMHRFAHGVTHPVLWGNRWGGNGKTEDERIKKYQHVMVCAMCPAMARKAMTYARHVRVKGFISLHTIRAECYGGP